MKPMKAYMNHSEAGFTFFELVMVVLVLAILISVASVNYSMIQEQTITDLVKADLRIIRSAIKSYNLENGSYPANLQTLKADGFLDDIPSDKFVPGGGAQYYYAVAGTSFTLRSFGPNKTDDNGGEDDITPDTP